MANSQLPEGASVARFFTACSNGDVETLRSLLTTDPRLAQATNPDAPHEGWTGLHAAAQCGHVAVVRLLLEHGADPNAREAGDNTYPLHWAAAHEHQDVVRALLDAGGDVHGAGDVHQLDAIGWATFYRAPGDESGHMNASRREVVALLLERGARHHIFSALCVGDLSVIQQVVEHAPASLDRRMSNFERGWTPLHFVIDRKRHDILDLLLAVGANVEAEDMHGQTALAMAMLRGDEEAMSRLRAAGATLPATTDRSSFKTCMVTLATAISKGVPMIRVPDVARALDWYTSIGFTELARYEDDGVVNFGMLSFGKAELMLNVHGTTGGHDVSLWFYTDQVDHLYRLLKSKQLAAAAAVLAGEPGAHEQVHVVQDLEDMFYGARQFCIRDLNGYELYFIQDLHI